MNLDILRFLNIDDQPFRVLYMGVVVLTYVSEISIVLRTLDLPSKLNKQIFRFRLIA